MATILLVHPAGIFEEAEILLNPSYPPLGIAYIGAYLLQHGHQVEIIDILGEGFDQTERVAGLCRVGVPLESLSRRVEGLVPDIIGITNAYTRNSDEAHRTLCCLRKLFPRAFIVMGGAHCSVLPEEVARDDDLDAVCVGEGEETMRELAALFDRCGNREQMIARLHEIAGLVLRIGADIHHTPIRKLMETLDTLPLPARHLLPMEKYSSGQSENPYYCRIPTTTMITSRGCPNRCLYCSVKSVWGRSWRGRNPESVVQEMKHLQQEYGIREISISDDALACNTKRLKEICREIIRQRLDIRWCTPNGIAIWMLDEECIDLMKAAGCYRLTFGLESGDPETMEKIRKRYNMDRARELIKYANRRGFWTIGTFIIGFPWETRSALENTFRFAMSSQVDLAVFYSAYPFPGTPLLDYYIEHGLEIPPESSVTVGGVSTPHLSAEEIARLRNEYIRKVAKDRILHGYRVLWKIRSAEDVKFVVRIARKGLGLVIKPKREGQSTSGILRE